MNGAARIRRPAAILAALLLACIAAAPRPARADFAEGFAAFQAEDYALAWTLLEPEADAGDRRAQFLLGEMLLKGLGRDADQFGAAGWFLQATREPDPDRYALYALATQYFNGDGVPRDIETALALFERAASLGVTDAMRSLAAIYARGEGDVVAQDLNLALRWLFAGAQAGDAAAAERFRRLAQAAGGTPPFQGRWVAIAYLATPDHPSWSLAPQFLPRLVGQQLALARGSFAMPGGGCNRPAYVHGTTTSADLALGLAGALPYGALAAADDTALTSLMVICDGTLAATVVRTAADQLLVSALGGLLVFDPVPSPTVRSAQELLAAAGYQPGPIDGLFGPRTGAALQQFQADTGLLATGAFDAATMFALAEAAATAAPGGAGDGAGDGSE
ncbi:MAG: SEL1-like repeat protein [Alphaproteobacteria bacterium]